MRSLPQGQGWLRAGAGEDGHDLVGVAPGADQVGHEAHRPVDVGEELLVTGAEVVESRFAVRGWGRNGSSGTPPDRRSAPRRPGSRRAGCRAWPGRSRASGGGQQVDQVCGGCCRSDPPVLRSGRRSRRLRCARGRPRCHRSHRRCTEVAVPAVQVADRTRRFGQHVERCRHTVVRAHAVTISLRWRASNL